MKNLWLGLAAVLLDLVSGSRMDRARKHRRPRESAFSSSRRGMQITDAGLEHLKGLTELQVLGIRDTQITGVGAADLSRGFAEVGNTEIVARPTVIAPTAANRFAVSRMSFTASPLNRAGFSPFASAICGSPFAGRGSQRGRRSFARH